MMMNGCEEVADWSSALRSRGVCVDIGTFQLSSKFQVASFKKNLLVFGLKGAAIGDRR
jgi:hypothetical protein